MNAVSDQLFICGIGNDVVVSYQAMLILLAWAIPEGFQQLERFISEKWDEKHSFEPHRIYNEDNVYDVIVDALYISTFNGKEEQELLTLM